jgi:hypothetical protein
MAGILPYESNIKEASGQFAELLRFDRAQQANAHTGASRYLLERDPVGLALGAQTFSKA